MAKEETRYLATWKMMRVRGWIAIIFAIAGTFYTVLWLIGVVTFDRHRFFQPYVLPIVIPILIINWYYSAKCPRCGKSFFKRRYRTELFTHNCVHCGMQRGSTG
jgi:hypothetical protein